VGAHREPLALEIDIDSLSQGARSDLTQVKYGIRQLDAAQCTETHLFDEFLSKMAAAHLVNGLKTHQIDFIPRDCERLFKHGNRMIEVTSKLFSNRPDG
jgi:hypothetical protein